MLGDNRSVIDSSINPVSVLNKRHNALAFNCVHATVASDIIYFCHIDGKENPTDIMTKLLPFCEFWPFVKPMLFWIGDTKDAHVKQSTTQGTKGSVRLALLLFPRRISLYQSLGLSPRSHGSFLWIQWLKLSELIMSPSVTMIMSMWTRV